MKYKIKKEEMQRVDYWMIYQRRFVFWWSFYERWNTEVSGKIRLDELNKG